MPSRPQLEELNRLISRALEKHGGAAGIARKMDSREGTASQGKGEA